ncbi:MAG: tetratricopeptide repeat protein [Bacteroidota bacterium]
MRRSTLFFLAFLVGVPASLRLFGQSSRENADFKLAINLYNDRLYDLAVEQLKLFIATYPSSSQSVDARFTLGLTELKLKRYEDARLTFQIFALTYQDHPRAPEAWWNVGESYAALRSYREAALAYERVKVFHPRSKIAPEALLKAAHCFLLAGDRDGSRKSLRVLLQEYPSAGAVIAARTQLARMYFEEGNLAQARSELKRVIDGDPSPEARAGALLILGNISAASGRTDQAREQFQEILTKYKSGSAARGARVSLGKLLAGTGDPAGALEQFTLALSGKGEGDSALTREALLGTGDVRAARGDVAGAVTAYEKVLASAPAEEASPEVLWKLALAAARAQMYRKSNDACTRLLGSAAPDPLRKRSRLRLALNAEEQKNVPLAIRHYEAFVDGAPEDAAAPGILLRVGRLAMASGEYRKAASVFELAATRYPTAPTTDDAVAGAGRAYDALKEYDRALQFYRQIDAAFPSSEYRPATDERMRMIEIFESRERDAGVEKLALLVGDVVAEKDRALLAYRLGEIYFNDLKNYAASAAQFANALEAGLAQDRAAEAMLKRAMSLDYLSLKDPSQASAAADAYRSYLAAAHQSPHTDEATLALFRLTAGDLVHARKEAAPLIADSSTFPRKDVVFLTLGRLYEGADSSSMSARCFAGAARVAADSLVGEEAGYRLFLLHARQGLIDSAYRAGRRLIDEFPRGIHAAEALAQLASLADSLHRPDERATLYRRLMTEYSYTEAAGRSHLPLADALTTAGDHDGALAAYEEIYRQQTDDPMGTGEADPSLLLALAKTHRAVGHTAEAKRLLVALLARVRTGASAGEALTTLGLMAREEGDREEATEYFRQAEAAAPNAPASRVVADALFASGNYGDAITQYARLSLNAASDTERQYCDAQTIVARLRNDDHARAEKEITAFLKKYKNATDDQAQFELEVGHYHFRREDYAAAMKSFQKVTDSFESSPSAPTARYWTAKTLEATDKPKEAIDLLEQLLADRPDAPIIPRVHLALGNLYYGAERWEDAIRNYRAIVENPSPDATLLEPAMSNLIETYEAAGAYDGALTLTRRYLETFPASEDALDKKIKIGILYDRLGYYDQAVLHLQSLLEEAGSELEGEIRYYIAEANYNKGDYQQAILDFLKVPYLVTKKGKIDWTANSLYMSGQSYEKMGRFDQALTMYQQIVDRGGIDESFKSAARKEIDRVKTVLKRRAN